MKLRMFLLMVLVSLGVSAMVGGCAMGPQDGQFGETQQAVKPPQACPAIAILCLEGYQVKQLPNCNQICVPEQQDFECTTDLDCGPIYCFTTPCEQPVCRGHQCVLPPSNGGNAGGSGQGGQPCGDTVCSGDMVCCNASCGICAPPDGACIQLACL